MTVELNILAAGEDSGGQVFGIVALLVFVAIAWIASKVGKKKQEEQRRQQAEKWRQEREQQAQHPAVPQQAAPHGQPQHAQPPAPPPHRQPTTAAQEVARAFREALGLEQAETPVPPPPPPPRPPPAAHPQMEPRRPQHKKPAPPAAPVEEKTPHMADVAPLPAAHAHAVQAAPQLARALTLDPNDHEQLLHAVLYREILGAPKALRHGDEMWDL